VAIEKQVFGKHETGTSYHRNVEGTYEHISQFNKRYRIVAPSVEAYAPNRRGYTKSIQLKLSHSSRTETLTYEVIDGLAIFEGDIILGPVDKVADRFLPLPETGDITTEPSPPGTRRYALMSHNDRHYLWPYGIIPFTIDSAFSQPMRNRINAAIAMVEMNTNLRLRQRRGETDYIRFRKSAEGCASFVGRQGGRQSIYINVSDCGRGTIAHEILHAAGMWHEHSRNDRDAYVRILWDNIKEKKWNFDKHSFNGTDVGSYDYGSIMHYKRTAWGKEDPATGNKLTTIETTRPANIGQRGNLSAGDIAGVNKIYPITVGFQGGESWGKYEFATAITFGDVDGDGIDEVGVARKSGVGARYWIFDDAVHNYRILHSGGYQGGNASYATDIAFGDVDGDSRDEVGITRKSGANYRYIILDDAAAGFRTLLSGGNKWGSKNYATGIAFGNVDNDDRDEVGITRKASSNYRYIILDDAAAGFRTLGSGGKKWGSRNYATGIAFGDVDGDGQDEVGITRKASSNYRYIILALRNGQLISLHTGGHRSGSSHYATSIAFGNVDGDRSDEVGITRKAGSNYRYIILDDFDHQFREILNRGAGWGAGNYANSIAFGDVDGDGRDEVGIARKADVNDRYWILDDAHEYFQTIEAGGSSWWGSNNFATDIAFGNVDGDNDADVGITWYVDVVNQWYSQNQMRYIILEMKR
jgi:hypothetical protein